MTTRVNGGCNDEVGWLKIGVGGHGIGCVFVMHVAEIGRLCMG